VSSSLLAEFADMQGANIVNDEVAASFRASAIAGSVIDELSAKHTDSFEFWDALLRMVPSTSALVDVARCFQPTGDRSAGVLWLYGQPDRR
jgi:hypothetical protein